ncbi:Zn(II)2Cys6 transcription factor [Aspergillus clavatus NRRL 1]|uniref:Zn(2)-C6 fungal-type domain-containing protein n=1 Tax=Aspergillus clavatus (strain ATCC 1007 / CBS 513.65 / DSM 816 / NCTC 3887 / NRRL 1 / QM 1276 / 107) TaxID=344612 RepID=A1CBP3_ASPCL|nr:uncharacterized protein ACLA_016070 [Aspergillus clavatus NRRL 1]EAW13161.1 conserved hypothetical protein [Aspergillus clavatus NRRL 1]
MEPASKPPIRKSPPTSTPAPRKRRKRTVVSGAPDDCFTCAREGSSCDRRRPYCSQCLDRGRDCSGYKTMLTWGVGVASRGKFRGLSLPVTGAQPAAKPDTSAPSPVNERELSQAAQAAEATVSPTTYTFAISSPVATAGIAGQAGARLPALEPPPKPNPIPIDQAGRTIDTNAWHAQSKFTVSASPSPPPHTQKDVWAIGTRPNPALTSATEQWQTLPARNLSITHDTEEPDRHKTQSGSRKPRSIARHSPSFSQMLLARSVGRTPRLRFLISYYAEVIAPVIVAFDSPTNPFRIHILRLAQDSESLQEAIATLATSNLRQRRESKTMPTDRTLPSRMSSLAHRALTEGACSDGHDALTPEGFAREEQYHRGLAVKALNMELADPRRRLSDSVLATLFILCLFHACDTGVTQFKTQLAGVTKLLALRMRGSRILSDELKWFIRVFAWYDTMAATTNDREIQLRGPCLEIAALSDSEWSLENLTGCDANLFKYIAQLGRLNLLSQEQEVSTPALPDIFVPTVSLPPPIVHGVPTLDVPGMGSNHNYPIPVTIRPTDRSERPLSPAFWDEWFGLRQQLEAWRMAPQRWESTSLSDPVQSTFPRLPYMSPPSSPSAQYVVAPQNVEDVYHISECFRHSAILYSERLAYPDLSSGHSRIQHLVQRAMHHISLVKSDVYLLWPLFITGSECVLETHRHTIRQRCKDISKDSGFFNNLSCLELLEKIWAQNSHNEGTPYGVSQLDGYDMSAAGPQGQGFRWHELMQAKRAEGEYMVV